MFKVSNGLIEAYMGAYEDDLAYDCEKEFEGKEADQHEKQGWVREKIIEKIISHTPEQRLEMYCNWNGIIGYHNYLYRIALGHLN